MKKLIFILLCACSVSSAMEKILKQAQEPEKPREYDSLFLLVNDQLTPEKQEQLITILKQNMNDFEKETTSIVGILLPNQKDRKTAESLANQIDILKSDLDCGNTAKAIANYYFKGNINNPHQMDHDYSSLFVFVKSVLNNDPTQIMQRETLYQEILAEEEKEENIQKKSKLLVELALPDQDNQKIAQSLCTKFIVEKEVFCALITSAVGAHFLQPFIKKYEDNKTKIDSRIEELQTQSSTLNQKKTELEEEMKQEIEDEKSRVKMLLQKLMEKNNQTYDN